MNAITSPLANYTKWMDINNAGRLVFEVQMKKIIKREHAVSAALVAVITDSAEVMGGFEKNIRYMHFVYAFCKK